MRTISLPPCAERGKSSPSWVLRLGVAEIYYPVMLNSPLL
jgi:hypothetical protein